MCSMLHERMRCVFLAGCCKTIVLVDSTGTEETLEFSKPTFAAWIKGNVLKQQLSDRSKVVATWVELQEGARYFTTRSLEKQVCQSSAYVVALY